MAESLYRSFFPDLDVHSIRERLYAPDRLDNDVYFREMIYDAVDSSMRVLDAGAGAGDLFLYDLKSRVREIVGVDLDRRIETNPQIHLGITANLETIPLEDETFDVVFSRYVLEHVSDPRKVSRRNASGPEARRPIPFSDSEQKALRGPRGPFHATEIPPLVQPQTGPERGGYVFHDV